MAGAAKPVSVKHAKKSSGIKKCQKRIYLLFQGGS